MGKWGELLDCDPDYHQDIKIISFFRGDATTYILIPFLKNKHFIIDRCYLEI